MGDSMPWFRAYTEMIDDEKLRLLAFEDRWHFVALLCCKSAGLLDAGDEPGLLRRKLAVKLGLASRELEEVARRLAEVGLVDFDTFQPIAWDERQFKSDNSTARVQAYRQRMKRPCNVSETAQDTDTDTDKETARAKASAASAKRGTRLPEKWLPSVTLLDFARQHVGDAAQIELEKFVDHWKAAPGSKGVRLDWDATFRNWIRNANKYQPKGVSRGTHELKPSLVDCAAGTIARQLAAAEAREREHAGEALDPGHGSMGAQVDFRPRIVAANG